MRICVVIPAYNEGKAIGEIIKKIRAQSLDVLVIDDGSSDSCGRIAGDAGATVLTNEKNLGKGTSLAKGFVYAVANAYDAIITMDGDGQHDPADIPNFISAIQSSGYGMLVGNRMIKVRNMPWLRIMTNHFMSWLISLVLGQKVPDTQCGFRLIRKAVLEKMKLKTNNFEVETEMLIQASRLGFTIGSVPISTIYTGEISRINPVTDTIRFARYILREIINKNP